MIRTHLEELLVSWGGIIDISVSWGSQINCIVEGAIEVTAHTQRMPLFKKKNEFLRISSYGVSSYGYEFLNLRTQLQLWPYQYLWLILMHSQHLTPSPSRFHVFMLQWHDWCIRVVLPEEFLHFHFPLRYQNIVFHNYRHVFEVITYITTTGTHVCKILRNWRSAAVLTV